MKFEGISTKLETVRGPEITRRQILESLAAVTAVSALGTPTEAHAETNSFSEWKERMSQHEHVKYVEHTDTELGPDFSYRLRGVTHIPATLMNKYEDIESEIEQSSAVLLEYFGPHMTVLANEPMAMSAEAVAAGQGELRKDVEANLFLHQEEEDNASFGTFFGTLGGMAARKGKDIFVVNPQNPASVEQSAMGATLPRMGIGFSIATIAGIAAELRAGMKKTDNEPLTRRDLFRRGLTGATTVAAGVTIAKQLTIESLDSDWRKLQEERLEITQRNLTALHEKGLVDETDPPEMQASKLIWCMDDWRNAVTALGILQMKKHDAEAQSDTEKYAPGEGTLLHFEGAMHVGVQDFLKDPKLTKDRVNFYNDTFNEAGNLSIRRFRFNKETEQFDMISEDPIIYKNDKDSLE